MQHVATAALILLTALAVGACGGSGSAANGAPPTSQPPPSNPPPASNPNQLPVAQISVSTVTLGASVTLDGSGSSDPDGEPLTFAWSLDEKPAGSSAALSGSASATASFVADAAGRYRVTLTVRDPSNGTGSRSIVIDAVGLTADAGPDQNVLTGHVVRLDGSESRSSSSGLLRYSWALLAMPSGAVVSLTSPGSPDPWFVPPVDGTYRLGLTVEDGTNVSAVDEVLVNCSSGRSPPVAFAGGDQVVRVGTRVGLDGTGSRDANRDMLTFEWRMEARPVGSGAAVQNPADAVTGFTPDVPGIYRLSLLVRDATSTSRTDSITIEAVSGNAPPVADAGRRQFVQTGTLARLDGSASRNPQGGSLSYAWTLIARPGSSSASIGNRTAVRADLQTDAEGTYVIELAAQGPDAQRGLDRMMVTAVTGNSPPVADAGPDRSVSATQAASLDGSASTDAEGDLLAYDWRVVRRPPGSTAALASATSRVASLTPDVDGQYVVDVSVSDGQYESERDTVVVTRTTTTTPPPSGGVSDDFAGDGPLLGYTTNNAAALPDVGRIGGRYNARLTDNTGDKTLHFNNSQGRLDAKLVSFPFEYIARNIGIGTLANSQSPPAADSNPFMFAGVQVHVTDLNSRNSAHVVVGHRGTTHFTIEGKNTINGVSAVNDIGAGIVPQGRADLRIVGETDRTLRVYWQTPNTNVGGTPDNWQPYGGTGRLPGNGAAFGPSVYVGLITYAFREASVPFTGTADSVQLVSE